MFLIYNLLVEHLFYNFLVGALLMYTFDQITTVDLIILI